MLRKLFIFILLSTFSCVVIFAQDTAKIDEKQAAEVLRFGFTGSGSYMGVEIKEVTKENFGEMGLSEVRGVGIAKVLKDSPAEKAGLLEGDVIIRFNSEILTSRLQLTRLISEVAPDHTANLAVLRNGTEVQIPITLGKRPAPRLFEGRYDFPQMTIPQGELPQVERIIPRGNAPEGVIWTLSSGRSIGVGVTALTKQLADHFGVKGGQGLLVNRVSKDGPAAKAGLKAGDIIVEIDGKPASGTNDLIRGIYEKKDGDLKLTVFRDKKLKNITVTPVARKSSPIITGENSN